MSPARNNPDAPDTLFATSNNGFVQVLLKIKDDLYPLPRCRMPHCIS
jgi:hypothetical protein